MPKNNSKHQIQKFSFDIGLETEELAFQFQSHFSAYLKEEILPLTETILDEYGKNKNIRINKLEIDLGNIDQHNFHSEFYRKFKERFSDKLRLLLAGYSTQPSEERVEVISVARSQFEMLLYFFEKGLLPWNSISSDTKGYVQNQLEEFISINPGKVKSLVKEIFSVPVSRLRFVRQIEVMLYWKVIQLYIGSDLTLLKKETEALIHFYTKYKFTRLTITEFKEVVYEYIAEAIILKRIKTGKEEVISELFIKFLASKAAVTELALVESILPSLGFKKDTKKQDWVPFKDIKKSKKTVDELHALIVKSFAQLLESGKLDIKKLISEQEKLTPTKKKNEDSSSVEYVLDKSDSKEDGFEEGSSEENRSESPIRKRSVSNSEQQKSFMNSLILQRVSAVSSLLKKYISLPVEYRQEAGFVSFNIQEIESYLKEILFFNPGIVKRIFQENNFDLKHYSNQQLIVALEPSLKELIIEQSFALTIPSFEKLVASTESKLVQQWITEGVLSVELKRKFNTKTKLNTLLKSYLKNQDWYEDLVLQLKGLPKQKLTLLNKLWKQQIDEPILVSYFMGLITRGEKKGVAGVITLEDLKLLGVESYSVDSILQLLEGLIVSKDDIGKSSNVLKKLIELVVKKDQQKLFYFISLLSPSQLAKINKYLTKDVLVQIEKQVAHTKELKDGLAADKKKTEDIEEKIKQVKAEAESAETDEIKEEIPVINQGEPVYITNAGIVILHPYLSMLFKKFELLNKKEFKDEYSLHKAVYLTQYLGTKTVNAEEHELVLNKIMCGMELSEPLRRDIEITGEEKEVCESLLEALIQNWAALKKTSPDSLRGSFFHREGRLLLEPQGWKLRVEEKGYDVLIEKLPWAISSVKLPWMKNIVYVEWR